MSKIVQAIVTDAIFIKAVGEASASLHLRGEVLNVNLDELGVAAIGSKTPGLAPHSDDLAAEIPQTSSHFDGPIAWTLNEGAPALHGGR